ncbi:polysaccharide biosynthesis protein [Metabacillus idriensis]|uniref:putative polysaccharide biosynthesis protein n=1 Tax=Metabacillus idriensis TaxID=324768 RepID=UPI00203FC5F5|nr:polysaccharide biosynthesis protein [Metabacillus idriensis]MCM3598937.1 polysaccharide biosynthesis protein [Metabacillus idriensis]
MDVRSDTSANLFLQGAFVLTLAGLIIKIMSAAYRVPYQNIVGDIGFYIYQQVYPFYGIAIMLATTGFPVIISKLIIEFGDKENNSSLFSILRISFLFLISVCALFFLCLYLGAVYISEIMGDAELAPLLKIISFSFLLLPFISIARGYFQGFDTMLPTALSQVTEQGIRVVTILLFSYILIQNGYSLYEAGEGALFGSLTGGIAAAAVLSVFLAKDKRRALFFQTEKSSIHAKTIIKYLLINTMTICITSLMLIFIQMIDAMQLYSALRSNGIEMSAAKALKGIYDRGQPLIQIGTVVATSFSLSLVPLISYAKKNHEDGVISDKITSSMKICTVIGTGAAAGLIVIMEPTNIMLFRDASGTSVLGILGISVLFTSYALTLSAILQGLSFTFFPAAAVVIGCAVKLGLNILLVPSMNTEGAAIATVAAYAVIGLLNAWYLKTKGYMLISWKDMQKTAAAAGLMLALLSLYMSVFDQYWADHNRLAATIGSLSGALAGAVIYLLAILKLSIFTKNELAAFPGGKKLEKFLK